MTIFCTDASAGDSVARLVGDIFTDLSRVLLMSDDEMFAGLEARTVADLQQRLQENPALRPTLCRAANYRAAHHSRSHRKPSRVYFIEATTSGLVKIGCASDPATRLRSLQTGSPEHLRLLATVGGGESLERELHKMFAADRSHGEWFRPSVALASFIEEVAAQ